MGHNMTDNITNRSGGIDFNAQQVSITGDVAGRDIIKQGSPAPIALNLHQLPAPPTDFTGRTADLDAILSDIKQGALISDVRGMGGIGKTALALVIADQLKAQYPDAQFFIPLRGVSDQPLRPLDALQSVIRAYHPTAQLPDDAIQLAALYRSVLDGQRAIILLDDARDASQIKALLPPASCLVLITTRNTFAVPGLHARKLETLSPADACDLLLAIEPRLDGVILSAAGAKDLLPPGVEVPRPFGSRNDTQRIADVLAYFCGYLPLALRAAASLIAATPDLDPLTYVTQLRDERTRLTKIGKEGVDIDVEASFNLSYQQLSPEAARVFRQLSVFPATFDAAAEESICDDPDHTHLSQLVRLSLVGYEAPILRLAKSGVRLRARIPGREARGRYRLHDLAHLFALSQFSNVDNKTLQARHAKHYLGILLKAEKLFRKGNKSAAHGMALFDLERLNIQGAQSWAAENAANDGIAARLCEKFALVEIVKLRLHPLEQAKWIEAALLVAQRNNDRLRQGFHLGNLGNIYCEGGDAHKALEYHEQALAIISEFGNRGDLAISISSLGDIHLLRGDTRKAIHLYRQALAIDRETNNHRGQASDLGKIANIYADQHNTRMAIKYYKQALEIAREIGERRLEGGLLSNLGTVYHSLSKMDKCIDLYEQALVIHRELGYLRFEGITLGNLANANLAFNRVQVAVNLYQKALVIDQKAGNIRSEGDTHWNISIALDILGAQVQAIAHAKAALKIYEQIEDPHAEMVRRQLAKWKGGQSEAIDGQQTNE